MTAKTTASDLMDRLAEREDFLGFGYLGNRAYMSEGARRLVDRAVVLAATDLGWTEEMLFHWTNSKMGRWFAEDSGWFHRNRRSAEARARATKSMRDSVAVFEDEMPGEWAEAKGGEAL